MFKNQSCFLLYLFFPFTSYFRLVNALAKFFLSDFGVPMMRAVIDLLDDVVDVDTLVMLVVSRRGVLSCAESCERNNPFLTTSTFHTKCKCKCDIGMNCLLWIGCLTDLVKYLGCVSSPSPELGRPAWSSLCGAPPPFLPSL